MIGFVLSVHRLDIAESRRNVRLAEAILTGVGDVIAVKHLDTST